MAFEKVGVQAVVEGMGTYVSELNRGQAATNKFANTAKSTGPAFRASTGDILKFAAASTGLYIGILGGAQVAGKALNGLVVDTVKAAINFESSFAGIRKTMDLTEAQFGQLATANRDLAKTIPVTVDELNKIGELGGQLGIRGVDNVVKFEDTIAKLAVTTNLTSEDAALAFAQIANVMQIPQDQIDRMGAAVVGLGNNFATTESDIVGFAQRIAGAGQIAHLTSGDVFGIAAAFTSVGVEAEAGGTSVQKVLLAMQAAVTDPKTTDELKVFAAVTNQTVEEFRKGFQDDAAGAFTSFVEGIAAAGDDGIRVLEALGLTDQRLIRSFLAAASSGDVLRRAVTQGNVETSKNTALQEEAAKRFDTTASKLQLLTNRFHDVQISAGDAALLGLEPLLDKTLDWLDTNGDQFAKDLAGAIESGIQVAADLAVQIGKIADLLNAIAQLGVVSFAIDFVMDNKAKALLVLAAAMTGLITMGPGGAIVLGGAALGGIALADLFGAMQGPGAAGAPSNAGGWSTQNKNAIAGSLRNRLNYTDSGTTYQFSEDSINTFLDAAAAFPEVFGKELAPALADKITGAVAAALRDNGSVTDVYNAIRVASGSGLSNTGIPKATSGAGGTGATNSAGLPTLLDSLLGDPTKVKKDAATALADLVSQADRARETLRKAQISELDSFGQLVVSALRDREQFILDATITTLDRQQKLYDDAADARIKNIEKVRDAALAALDAETKGTVDGLNAQIKALDEKQAVDRRAALVRELALTYDAKDRAALEQQIADLDTEAQKTALRDQISAVQVAADEKAKALRDGATDAIATAETEKAKVDANYTDLRNLAQKHFADMTSDFALESAARTAILDGEQKDLLALLTNYAPAWTTLGKSFGEALIDGLNPSLDAIAGRVAGLVGGLQAGPTAVARTPAELAGIATEQQTGKAAVAGGAPSWIIDSYRKILTDLGVVPQFAGGGYTGDYQGLAYVHPHELILNPAQQAVAAGGGPTFDRGAFEGMFAGATFAGSPADNMREAKKVFRQMMDDQLGPDAFRYGVRR